MWILAYVFLTASEYKYAPVILRSSVKKDSVFKASCKVYFQSYMSGIGGRGCRVVISAEESCLSACGCILFVEVSIYFDACKLTNQNISQGR